MPVATAAITRRAALVVRSFQGEGLGFLSLWPRIHNSVPGWLTPTDARMLYALAHHGPGKGAIVEIGSAWGRSTIVLAAGAKNANREKVHAIDPHTGDPFWLRGDQLALRILPGGSWLSRRWSSSEYRDGESFLQRTDRQRFSSLDGFRHNIQRFGVSDWVIPVVKTSTDAAESLDPGPIRLLFIDGLHTYEGVKADIDGWVHRVAPGGVIVFDDYLNDAEGLGVRRAVDELLTSGMVEPKLRHSGGLHVWVTKR